MALKKQNRIYALISAALVLTFGGCLKIERIDRLEEPAVIDPIPGVSPETVSIGNDSPEPPLPEVITVDEKLLADAVALGIAGNGERYIDEADGLWNVIGWYAALRARTVGEDEDPWLSSGTCDALCSILRPDKEPIPIPERWMSAGTSRETRDGVAGILFSAYETLLDNTLGVWREISQTEEGGTRVVSVTDHLDGGTETFLVYAAFAEDPTDRRTKLVYLVMTDPIRTPELSFTLADVREQNRIPNLLSVYSCVTLDMSDEFGTAYQSFWQKDGGTVFYEVDEAEWEDGEGNPLIHHTENGHYRGVSFNNYPFGEPMALVWVTAAPEDHAEEAYYENYIVSFIPEDEDVIGGPTGVLETDDSVSFGVTERYETEDGQTLEIRHTYTVDRSTLAVLAYHTEYTAPDGSFYESGFTVSYNGTKLGEEAMKAWDSPRAVTFDYKTAGGERTETVTVPGSWSLQLLPDEGLTVYYDAALTLPTDNTIDGGEDIALYVRD